MVPSVTNPDRRRFLQSGVLISGGLLIGVSVIEGVQAAAPFEPNAFIRITPDDKVTVIVGLSEMGQGVMTAIPQLVAEELPVDWSRISVEQAPTDRAYINPLQEAQATGGSTSIEAFWEPMRQAGAAAREMLLAAGAATWHADIADCRAERGSVVHQDGRRLSYGQLASTASGLTVPANVKLKESSRFTLVGQGLRRLDTPEKVDGRAIFGIDVRVPGMLTAVVEPAPWHGAVLVLLDADKARRMPGVRHVLPIGSGIAVVANDYWSASKARRALIIEWGRGSGGRQSSEDISRELLELTNAPAVVARNEGDVANTKAATTIVADYEVPYLAHACMEPMNCTAWVRLDSVDIWAPTQAQTDAQKACAKLTGLAPESIRVHTTLLGGGFGRRYAQDFLSDAVEISKAVGAPIKVIYSREDDMRRQYYRPAARARLTGGLSESGELLAFQARIACSSIALVYGEPMKDGIDASAVQGLKQWPYDTSNLRIEWADHEPGITVWYMRAVGHSQNIFFAESFVDELAHAARRDPVEYRVAMLSKQPRLRRVLEESARRSNWSVALPVGRARGIAISDFWGTAVAQVAEVSLGRDGQPQVDRVVCAVDCGMVVNPEIVKRQMEGAIILALSSALYGQITFKDGRVQQRNFDNYRVVRMREAPEIDVHIVGSTEKPTGVGESGVPPLAPALTNAWFALTGKRIRSLPMIGDKAAA
jgi:isoquinoline 1-oxidoreductase subunit beta